MFLNINPDKGKPEGSYFGISVFDGYNWHECYSYAWEIRMYFNGIGIYESFPEMTEDDVPGIMHQCIAINQGYAEMPEERFFKKEIIQDMGADSL